MKATALELTRALSKLRPDCVIFVPCGELGPQFNTTDEVALKTLIDTPQAQAVLLVPAEGAWSKKDYSIPEKKP